MRPTAEPGARHSGGVLMAKSMSATVLVFKVALKGNKRVWRRIAVRGNQTLDDFHEAIFGAFDRDDEHLYSFPFPIPGLRGRAALRGAREYTHPEAVESSSGSTSHNAADTPVQTLGLVRGQKLLYLFDFGDEWWHEVTVEQIDAPVEKGAYPRVLERKGKSPSQYPDEDEEDE
jgi:hypothetical protein